MTYYWDLPKFTAVCSIWGSSGSEACSRCGKRIVIADKAALQKMDYGWAHKDLAVCVQYLGERMTENETLTEKLKAYVENLTKKRRWRWSREMQKI